MADVFLQTGFEGSSSLPTGWSNSTITGGATWSIQNGGASGNPSAAYNGTKNAILFASNTNDNTSRLISPTFDTTGFTNITLKFWHAQTVWYSDQDELKIFYSSNGGSTWTELANYTESQSTWIERTVSIPSASTNSRIAFEGKAKWGYGVCIDDIEVSGISDSLSEVFVTASDTSAAESGQDTGTWTITRTGNTAGALTVNYSLSGSATSGSDYNVDDTSPINFAAGQTTKVVTLTPIDDTVSAEGEETATLTLTSGSGYVINSSADSGTISILDDEGFDLNILIIGSTHSFSEGGEHDVVHEKPFNPTNIATHLQSILRNDTALNKTVNVQFEDVFKFKTNNVRTSKTGIADITAHCYSLAQHFMWPDGKAQRLANIRGEDGVEWDYIILCSDPYIMANFPGMYVEGVKLIKDEAARSSNDVAPQVVLFAQWPENSSTFSADDFNEIVYRTGNTSGLTVVPAGKAWDTYSSQDTNAAHPTPRGEYLAAATIYSKLYNRNAKNSGHTFASDGVNIADHALSVVQNTSSATQYTGTYTRITPFQMKYTQKRDYNFRETGTSTEDGLAGGLNRLDDVARITMIRNLGTFWDFNYGRGNDGWEDDKDYEVDPTKYDRSYGFPMHHYYTGTAANAAAQTMPYGIDKYYYGSTYEDGTDLGIAYNMIRPNTRETSLPADVRCIPIRLLWLKMEQAYPGFAPLGDNTHMGPHLHDASAAFMYTLISGRCPVVDEPATPGSTAWMQWLGHKIGYETAWQMSHITTRPPGFQVFPSASTAKIITPNTSDTMTVRFVNQPTHNVTVSISSSNSAYATVSTNTLTFTPDNYDTPQEVIISGVGADQRMQDVTVTFTTSSTDEDYDNLTDSWSYVSNTESLKYGPTVLLAGFDGNNIANTTSTTAGVNKVITNPIFSSTSQAEVSATLSTSDALEKALQWAGMTSPSQWGTTSLTPLPTTTTNLVFAANQAATFSFLIQNNGDKNVTLETLHFRLSRDGTYSADQVIIALAGGDLSSSGSGSQALSSGANHYNYDLSNILTDATLAPGESATISFSIAPTDPAGGRVRVDNMALSGTIMAAVNITTYNIWSGRNFARPFNSTSLTDNPDGDNLTNLQEYAFGLDPTHAATPSLTYSDGGSVSQAGTPIIESTSTNYKAVFVRRKDHAIVGLIYTVEFSADLELWTTDNTTPTRLTGDNSDEYEAVSVPFPTDVPVNSGGANQPPQFFRIGVDMP